jgi:hypothetical protein
MDRPSGPLGAATQSTGRGLPENPAQGVRRPMGSMGQNILTAPPMPPIPPMPPVPPMPTMIRNMPSASSLAVSAPMAPGQVIALAREAMQHALAENENKAAEASAVSTDLKPGLTIDLSRKNIHWLPDEVVDVIKNELERLVPK